MRTRNWFITVGDRRVGLQIDTIGISGKPYMDRWIVFLGVGSSCLRLHKFYRGDDDRAPHDHPWNFITFPLTTYEERVYPIVAAADLGRISQQGFVQTVRALRVHRRASEYRHMVLGRADGKTTPFWTIVFAYGKHRKWGFWPTPETFVYWRFWT